MLGPIEKSDLFPPPTVILFYNDLFLPTKQIHTEAVVPLDNSVANQEKDHGSASITDNC